MYITHIYIHIYTNHIYVILYIHTVDHRNHTQLAWPGGISENGMGKKLVINSAPPHGLPPSYFIPRGWEKNPQKLVGRDPSSGDILT